MPTSRSWARRMTELSAILAIAHRDFVKLLRDRARIVSDFAFPLLLVAFPGPRPPARLRAVAIVAVGLLLGVPFSLATIIALVPVVCVIAVFGGAFGILVLSNLGSQRTANQIFPFIMLPQFFLAGVFNPLQNLPWFLDVLSRVAPMRYAVDLLRNVYS